MERGMKMFRHAFLLMMGILLLAAMPVRATNMTFGSMTIYDVEKAFALMQKAAVDHKTETFEWELYTDQAIASQELFNDVASFLQETLWNKMLEHTGLPTGGDYLLPILDKHNFRVQTVEKIAEDRYKNVVTSTLVFTTTLAQEEKTTKKATELLNTLLAGKTKPEDKVRAIYDWVVKNVEFSDRTMINGIWKASSAYDALINKSTACQGYATLMYRLLLQAGFDCRVVYGAKKGGASHSWNIVQLEKGGGYYYLDASDGKTTGNPDNYFLKKQFAHTPYHYDPIRYPLASDDRELVRIVFECPNYVLYKGEKASLAVTVTGDTIESYKSSDKSVVKISSTGKMTAVGIGTATITVKTKNSLRKATCSVEVKKPTITLSEGTINLLTGKTATIEIKSAVPKAKGLTYSSTKPTVATVNKEGVITAKAVGTAKITVKTSLGAKATCTVNVPFVPGSIKTQSIKAGTTKELSYSITTTKTLGKKISVSVKSSDEKTVKVSSSTWNKKGTLKMVLEAPKKPAKKTATIMVTMTFGKLSKTKSFKVRVK